MKGHEKDGRGRKVKSLDALALSSKKSHMKIRKMEINFLIKRRAKRGTNRSGLRGEGNVYEGKEGEVKFLFTAARKEMTTRRESRNWVTEGRGLFTRRGERSP